MNTKRGPLRVKWALLLLAVLLPAAGIAAWMITPGVSRPQAVRGEAVLRMESDGTVLLSWPETDGLSRVLLRAGGEEEYRLLDEFTGNTAVLDGALLEQPLAIQIQSAVRGKNLLGVEREFLSRESLAVEIPAGAALLPELTVEGGGEPGELLLAWEGRGAYELAVLEDGAWRALREVSGGSALLRFGEDGELPLPSYDQPAQLTLRAVRRGEGYVLYGPPAAPAGVRREVLLGSDLSVECQRLGERTYALRWNETKGDYYEVQEWSSRKNAWEPLAEVARDGELCYETGLLRSGSDHRYRVVAVGGDPDDPAAPAEASFRAEISTRYATVWPVVETGYYEDAGLARPLGKIPAGTALCVLEEEADGFQVRYKDNCVWVDSRFCMINLPEYIGDVCAYDITNSYSSIFMVHGYPLQHITGQVVQGFEGVDTAEDGFLVPYLYPSAKKLLAAAQAAEEDGYRLRIYEAFRPNEATRFLYDTALAQLDYPLPELDKETGEYVFYDPPAEPEPVPEPNREEVPEEAPAEGGAAPLPEDGPVLPEEDGQEEAPEPSPDGLSPEEAPLDEPPPGLLDEEGGLQKEPQPGPPEEEAPPAPTFRQIMTDGRFGINSFLAASVSAHNRGIALDLTIERLDGTPLEMQAAMHDLSWYSAAYLNNDNAKLLASYMTMPGVEMRGLTSEWWHFQDDDTREAIGLTSYLYKGVTARGWTRDGTGWRYRDETGRYLRNTTIKTDGRQYVLDENGYAAD